MFDFILTGIFVGLFVYLLVKYILEYKSTLAVERYFDPIPLHGETETDVPFYWSSTSVPSSLADFDYSKLINNINTDNGHTGLTELTGLEQSVIGERRFELKYKRSIDTSSKSNIVDSKHSTNNINSMELVDKVESMDYEDGIQRDCFDGYFPTTMTKYGFGCVTDKGSCVGKVAGEFVADSISRYEIHECDGSGNILKTHDCYNSGISNTPTSDVNISNNNNENSITMLNSRDGGYSLPFACGSSNPCFNKEDGLLLDRANRSYTYSVCKNGILYEKECEDRFRQYFDRGTGRCEPAPTECVRLKPYETVTVGKLFCYNDSEGLNVLSLPLKRVQNIHDIKYLQDLQNRECEYGTSLNRPLPATHVPSLWTVSTSYLKCAKEGYWNVDFCAPSKSSKSSFNHLNQNNRLNLVSVGSASSQTLQPSQTSQTTQLLRKVRELPDGIMFTVPDMDSVQVFDPVSRKCVPFDYNKHYKDSRVPLILQNPLLKPFVNLLFEYDLKDSTKKQVVPLDERSVLNSAFNEYVTFPQIQQSQEYTDEDNQKCEDKFKGDLTVYNIAYRDVILSCFFKSPIHKEVVSKDDTPSIWNRVQLSSSSYKLASGATVKCPDRHTIHKYIITCVQDSCSRIDFPLPRSYPAEYPALGTNYKHTNFVVCTREGELVYSNTIRPNFKDVLRKYCGDGTVAEMVHPFYNLPLNCSESAKQFIINEKSYRTYTQSFTVEEDSIFKTDMNALDLMFIPGLVQ